MSRPAPPKWPDRFLGWYCNNRVREQVQGDAHELFYWRLEEKGPAAAKRAFVWDVIRLFKWSNIKPVNDERAPDHMAMFRSYFKIGLRNLWKQRMASTINVIGLSLAIGCCLVAFKFIESSLMKDRFHENGDRIYMATHSAFVDNQMSQYGYLSAEVSELMRERFPEIKRVMRYASQGVLVKKGEDKIFSHAVFTDDGFFESFSFPVVSGDVNALSNPRNVVITENTALQFFGDKDPLGQIITLDVNNQEEDFIVAAICKDSPLSSSIRLGVIMNHLILREGEEPGDFNSGVLVELEAEVRSESLRPKLQTLAKLQRDLDRERKYEDITLVLLKSMSSRANEIRGGIGTAPAIAPIILLASIAGFMLILSTFNYINIATFMGVKRVKEIEVRKVIGGKRRQLVVQFLTENLIVCTLSVGLGCLLAAGFFLPQFSLISGATFTLDLLHDRELLLFVLGLLGFITLVSGAYPAFIVSAVKPVNLFRGGEKPGGKKRITSFLLSFQFTLATVTIIAAIMFIQTNYVNERRDWGYDQNDKFVVGLGPQVYPEMRDKALENPGVIMVAGSRGTIGKSYISGRGQVGEHSAQVEVLRGDADYARLLGLKLKDGRYFDKELKGDVKSSIMVNEAFMEEFSLSFSGDNLVRIDSTNYHITGVLEDFHYHAFDERIGPAVIHLIADNEVTHMTVHTTNGALASVEAILRKAWHETVGEEEFYSYRQSEVFDGYFSDVRGVGNIILFTAILSIILSVMGLFGLVSLSVSSKIKDFSIKKILGASAIQLSGDVYRKFITILGLAIVVGSTLAVFVISMLLDSAYGYHAPINLLSLALSTLILLAVAGITINTQVRYVRRINPAETLRSE